MRSLLNPGFPAPRSASFGAAEEPTFTAAHPYLTATLVAGFAFGAWKLYQYSEAHPTPQMRGAR